MFRQAFFVVVLFLLYLFLTVFSLHPPAASPLHRTLLISLASAIFSSVQFMWKSSPSPGQHKHGSLTIVQTRVVNHKHGIDGK